MISELSAGFKCRLFGTGLVMSENASDCTQNAAYRDRKLKNFLGRGHSPLPKPLPHWEGDTPSPNPTLLGTSILGAYGASIDLLPLHFHHLPPPISHFWLRGCFLFAFYSNYGRIGNLCEIVSVKQWCDRENRVRVRSRSLEMTRFDRSHTSSY